MNVRRNIKHKVGQFTPIQVQVREATSNDPWGPPTALMADISDATHHSGLLDEIFQIIWKRLGDDGKNWRHVFKSLVLIEYLVKTGPMSVVELCCAQVFAISTLKNFQFEDKDGKDHGVNVRERAKNIAMILKDPDLLREERDKAMRVKRTFSRHPEVNDNVTPDSPENTKPQSVRSASVTALSGQERNLDSTSQRSSGCSPSPLEARRVDGIAAANQLTPDMARRSGGEEKLVNRALSKITDRVNGGVAASTSAPIKPYTESDPWGATVQSANPRLPLGGSPQPSNDPWDSPRKNREIDAFGSPTFVRASPQAVAVHGGAVDAFGSPTFARGVTGTSRDKPAVSDAFGSPQFVRTAQAASSSAPVSVLSSHGGELPAAIMPQQHGSPATGRVATPDMVYEASRSIEPPVSPVEPKPTFLDDKACALLELDNVMAAKPKPQSPKVTNSLNSIRMTNAGAASPGATALPSPLIPAPLPGQTRVQAGPTWTAPMYAQMQQMQYNQYGQQQQMQPALQQAPVMQQSQLMQQAQAMQNAQAMQQQQAQAMQQQQAQAMQQQHAQAMQQQQAMQHSANNNPFL